MPPGLVERQDGPTRVPDHGHPADPWDLQGRGQDEPARLLGPLRGLLGVLHAHVREPVGRDVLEDLALHLEETADLLAPDLKKGIGARLPHPAFTGIPTEQVAVEALGTLGLSGSELDPAELSMRS
jgi:hypothetical protein